MQEENLLHTLGLPFLNLGILIGLLVYYLRAPIRNFVALRHDTIRDEVQRSRLLLHEAQAKYDEFTAKLRAFEAEAASIRQQIQQDAQAAKQRILSDAQRLSATIVSDARTSAQGLFGDLRAQLAAEVGNRIIDRAERLLKDRLTGEDRARLKREFSMQVGGTR